MNSVTASDDGDWPGITVATRLSGTGIGVDDRMASRDMLKEQIPDLSLERHDLGVYLLY